MVSLRYRVVVMLKLIVAVGLRLYPADATMSVKFDPVVLPCTASVSVRAAQAEGIFRITLFTCTDAPRSTCSHCGKALFTLSQYVAWLPSLALLAGYTSLWLLSLIALPLARLPLELAV